MDELVWPSDKTLTRHWAQRLLDPLVLFTVIAFIGLTVIWGATLNIVANERAVAERAATLLTADVANTYEAQMVRALREIDQTLKIIRLDMRYKGPQDALTDLRTQGLLPPELIFTVSIHDAEGKPIASTHLNGVQHVADLGYFQRAQKQDAMAIGQPHYEETADEWRLHFARRFIEANGRFAGIVVVSVHAGYFVSGYESSTMGRSGVLGLVGTDGVFRARRTGEMVSTGDVTDYEALVSANGAGDNEVRIEINDWDGVHRYTIARKLFDYPLAIVVGLSQVEQLAPTNRAKVTYFGRAGAASVLLIAVIGLLARLSWQLQRARVRSMEERVAHAQRTEYLAYHDSLTELPNRASFSQLLPGKLSEATHHDGELGLIFLDLDRFKTVNDAFGHEAGDGLLREMGRRLQGAVGKNDFVARLGGDEFVVVLPDIAASDEIPAAADNILSVVGKPVTVGGRQVRVTASMGITRFPHDGTEEQTLMKNADMAMYRAKERGRNNFEFFSHELHSRTLERLTLESDLRNALEKQEFRLFYQAKRDIKNDELTGMEVLLRWEHPDLGTIKPVQFVELAEESGLIVPIGRWVLETACQQIVSWQQKGLPTLSVAVNLSARQFLDDNLIQDVIGALRETGMSPHLLELEITESMMMHDVERTVRILKNLRQAGVRIAVDDFGTGYSSLSTLKQFPVDTVKIDRLFVRDVVRGSEDKALTKAIIALGKNLGLTIVAEGVEFREQAMFLRTHGCDQYQGFFINKPMPADQFEHLIREHTRAQALS